MSTFDGRVAEFPDIRIDYFRATQDANESPPLAYFLSHVHSDHLVGLETCRSPFIYCSPATRDILLRLEKYPHRINFAKGILESRRQTYGHLRKLLKAIPLETRTVIELAPGKTVRVTLFDANHCVGAVAFLIEGDGKAVFYSGDVRAEAWWVEALVGNPLMVPYTIKGGRRLDCVYLDTTFATSGEGGRYREFPSKVEGLRELVQKMVSYPDDTVFYYDAWTFGYEDVWQTLSTILDAKVHVDDYRYGLYRALKNGVEPKAPEATKLMGFWCGNHYQEGCLTNQWSRLHSCEYGTGCPVWEKDFVRITPIISRHQGVEIRELGAGGGKGDLNPKHEFEFGDAQTMLQMLEAHEAKLKGQPGTLSNTWKSVAAVVGKEAQALSLDVPALGLTKNDAAAQSADFDVLEDVSLDKLLPALAQWLQNGKKSGAVDEGSFNPSPPGKDNTLPKQITFPYSRHSSYSELCLLITALTPRDIYPCTVDSANWDAAQHSMAALFGHLYDDEDEDEDAMPVFSHDRLMAGRKGVDVQPWRPYRGLGVKRRSTLISEGSRRDSPEPQRGEGEEVPSSAQDALHKTRKVLSGGAASYAWRKEVHDSVLGIHGRRWEDVELVSVAGHQHREVEL